MVKLVILRALTSKCCESYFHTFVGNKTTNVCFFYRFFFIGELPKSSRSFSCSSTVYSKDRGRGTPPCAPIPQEMSPTFTGGQHMHRTGGGSWLDRGVRSWDDCWKPKNVGFQRQSLRRSWFRSNIGVYNEFWRQLNISMEYTPGPGYA